jgi:hypothetical protein
MKELGAVLEDAESQGPSLADIDSPPIHIRLYTMNGPIFSSGSGLAFG